MRRLSPATSLRDSSRVRQSRRSSMCGLAMAYDVSSVFVQGGRPRARLPFVATHDREGAVAAVVRRTTR